MAARHLPALLVALGLALAPVVAAHADSDTSNKLLMKGRQAFRKGEHARAIDLFKRSIKEDPANDEARLELGAVLLRTGQFLPAEQQLRLSLKSGKLAEGKAVPLLAAALLADHRYQELRDLRYCDADATCKADLLAQQARADMAMGDLKAAAAAIADSHKIVPGDLSTRFAEALLQKANGDWAESERSVDAVIAAKPKLPEALALKGELRAHAGDLAGSVAAYRASVQADPNDVSTEVGLVMALLAANRQPEAEKEIDGMLARGADSEDLIDLPDPGASADEIAQTEDERMQAVSPFSIMGRYLKSTLLMQDKHPKEALDMIRPVEVQVANGIPRASYLLAAIYSGNGQMEQALQYAATFNNSFPNNMAGTLLIANINYVIGNYHKVIETLEPLHERLMDDGDSLALLGSSYLAEGRIEEANKALNESLKARPNDAVTRARLDLAKSARSSSYREGLDDLAALVRSNPGNPRIDLTLISTYFATGDYRHAAEAADEMAKHLPDSPLPPILRGEAELEMGNEAGARQDFQSSLGKDPTYTAAAVALSFLDMRLGDSAGARQVLDSLLKRQPADLGALIARAGIEQRQGMPAAAVPFLRTAITSHPEEAAPRMALLRTLLAQGDRKAALREAEELGARFPDNSTALNLAATTCIALGDPDTGLRLFRDLESRDPNSASVAHRYGQLLAATGKFREARAEYARAVAEEPAYLPPWVDFALVERHLSGLDAALDVARKAQAHNPTSDLAALLRGDVLRVAGKLREAERAYDEVMAKTPTSNGAERLFAVILQQEDRRRALEYAEAWLKAHPDDLRIHRELADVQMSAGAAQSALPHYALIAEKSPRDASALNNLAWAYYRLDDPRALETAKKAFQLAPNAPDIMDTYAFLQYRKGDAKAGADLILQAYGTSPTTPEIAYHLAVLLADKDNGRQALEILRKLTDAKVKFDDQDEALKLRARLEGRP